MAFSYVTYTGNGSNKNFAVPFGYISREDVTVKVDGVLVTFTWLNDAMVQTAVAPANATLVDVRRSTEKSEPLVDFEDASTLTESDLDLFATQMLYISQEAYDSLVGSISLNEDGNYDAGNRRVARLADPIDGNDAVNKTWAMTNMASQLAQAIAAKDTAVAAKDAAVPAAATAVSARDTTITAKDVAVAAKDATITKAAEAAASNASAATHDTNASTSASQANTAKTDAVAAKVAAELAYDQFDDRYLGPKSTAPTTDNDGGVLQIGALYFQTTGSPGMRYWDGTSWQVAYNPSLGSVDSVFGRTGAIVGANGDYNAGQVTNTPAGNIAATNVQAAINELDTEKQAVSQKGAANGYASLDGAGKVPVGQLPSIVITDTYVVASQAAMLALSTAEQGDIAVRSDINKTFVLATNAYGTLADWVELKTPTDVVLSVAGLTGAITSAALKTALALVKADVGLGSVDNTSDANKPVSTAQAAADAVKSNITRAVRGWNGAGDTLVIGDAGNVVMPYPGTAQVQTIPNNSAVPFPVYTQIDIIQYGAGAITFTPAAGVTLLAADSKAKLNKPYTAATLIKLNTNEWLLTGALVS